MPVRVGSFWGQCSNLDSVAGKDARSFARDPRRLWPGAMIASGVSSSALSAIRRISFSYFEFVGLKSIRSIQAMTPPSVTLS